MDSSRNAYITGFTKSNDFPTQDPLQPDFGGDGDAFAVKLNVSGSALVYFDFGEVPKTDEFGNVIGTFNYRNYAIIAAGGMKAANLPFLARMPLAENIGFGLKATLFKVSTLDPGNGRGFSLNLPFLFRSGSPSPQASIITGYGFGLVIQNFISLPINYASGHQESWPQRLNIGMSFELFNRVILAMDITSEKNVRFGVEWTPIPVVSFRGGFRYEHILR